ncbi:hypothetical protein F2Q69_00036740 [Brassica cretica]|uniref:Uncharacterized protein n=1 Tax=Brassica cretica TaxID=69181 RepID=A0A8S9SDN4_BRACR|nr:hypothetical protein F2Q69_00036740 [Brassica cretica]
MPIQSSSISDAPQSMDQHMEPYQNGDQTVQDSSAEVRLPSRTVQDDRAVYRLDPLTSGMKLRPSPRPEDRSDRTSTRPSQPSRQAKVNSRAKLDLDHARLDMDHVRLDVDHARLDLDHARLDWIVRFPKMIETSLSWFVWHEPTVPMIEPMD